MKRVLLLITLAVFTFTAGHAQFDVKTQPGYDAQMEEIYGPAPTSDDLPSALNFSLTKGGRDLTDIEGYGSLIPASGSYSGKFYKIDFETGKTQTVKNYPSYYFTAAEFYDGKVYVFCNDFTKGFGTLNLTTGVYTKIAKISKGMTDLTYNYNQGKMYGLRYGKIWEINMADGSATTQVTADNNYIAIACDTYGNMFAVTQDATNNAQLVKFTGCNWASPTVINSNLGYKTQYTQSMAYDHNSDKLIWWQISKEGKHIVELDPTTGAVVGTPASTSTSVGGLFFEYYNTPQAITTVFEEAHGNVTTDKATANKGETVTITVTPLNCNEIASVTATTTTSTLTVTQTATPGVYTFLMPSKPVTVNVEFTVHAVVESVTIEADKQYLCFGEKATLTATATCTELVSYDWYLEGVNKATTTENTYEAAEQGNWSVKAYTQYGCSATSGTVAININGVVESPELSTNKTTVCPGGTATITITGLVEGDKMVRYVNGTAIDTEPVAFSSTWEVTPETTSTYKVVGYQNYMGEIFCESYESNTPTINVDAPEVTITADKESTCSAAQFTLSASGAETYVWSCEEIEGFGQPTGEQITFTVPSVTEVKQYTVKVTGTNDNDCTGEAEIVLTVNPLPTVALKEKVEMIQVCPGGEFGLRVENHNYNLYDYQWYKDGEVIPGANRYVYRKTTNDESDAGNYSVVATTKAEPKCSSEPATMGVNVVETADAPNVVYPEEICYDYTATLDFGYNYEPEDFMFFWDQNFGSVRDPLWRNQWSVSGASDPETGEPADLSWETGNLRENTQFRLRVRHIWAQDDGNCWAYSETFTVKVKPNTPVTVAAYNGVDELNFVDGHYISCFGNTFDLIAQEGFKTYQWQKKEGEAYVDIDGAKERIYHNEDDTAIGDYYYRVVVTDNTECEYHGDLTVRINAIPDITIENLELDPETGAYSMEVCSGVETIIQAKGADKYEWGIEPEDEGVKSFSPDGNECTFTLTGGDYVIWVIGGNTTTNCSNSTTVSVHVNPLPELAITSPVNGTEYDMITHMIDLTATVGGETVAGGTFTLDGEAYEGTQIDLMLLKEGEHEVTYTFEDEKRCMNTATSKFSIAPKKYWSEADIRQGSWYEDVPEERYEIGSAEEFGYLLYLLDPDLSGEKYDNFDGKIIHLVNDIDLGARFVKPFTGFKGVFEGYGKIIKNMTICDPVTGEIANNGTIRNLGVKDAMVYLTTNTVEGNLANYGFMYNSYITGSTFRLMGEKAYHILNAANARIQNYYLAGSKVIDEQTLTVTMPEGSVFDHVWSDKAVSFSEVEIPAFTNDSTLMNDLNVWVNDMNTADFIDWEADTTDRNYGHPVHEAFMHMVHYNVDLMHVVGGTGDIDRSNIQDYEDGTYDLVVRRNKAKKVENPTEAIDWTMYGFAYDTVTVAITPEQYCKLSSLNVVTDLGVEVEPYEAEVEGETYTFYRMPVAPLQITANINKDYWTDADYADFSPFISLAEDRYEINNAAQLAALARIVNGINLPTGTSQYDFEGKEIHLTNDINLENHMWKPIDGFKGIFEGYGKYIENMYTIDDAAALFANVGNGAVVRNLGIRDAKVETTGEGTTTATVYYSENFDSYETGGAPTNWRTDGDAYCKVEGLKEGNHLKIGINRSRSEATSDVVFSDLFNLNGSKGVYIDLNIGFDQGERGDKDGAQEWALAVWIDNGYTVKPLGIHHPGDNPRVRYTLTNEEYLINYVSLGFELISIPASKAFTVDNIIVTEIAEVGGGAAIAVNNAGSIMNCYVTSSKINGNNAVTGVAVANNAEGAQVKNVYGGNLKEGSNVEKFIANNAGTSESNFVEFTTEETGVAKYEDKQAITGNLNNWVVNLASQTYYPWENKEGENNGYPIFTDAVHYFVAVEPTSNGKIVPTPNHALAGETITVTATADTGYNLTSLIVKYDAGEGIEYHEIVTTKQFEMPAANVTVSATFTKIDYAITYAPTQAQAQAGEANGYITGAPTAQIGDEVTITVVPNTGFELDKLMAANTADTVDITATKKFTMGAAPITVTATFKNIIYMVACTEPENGTILILPDELLTTTGIYEQTIGVLVTPDTGYKLKSLKYQRLDTYEEFPIQYNEEEEEYQFKMPAAGVIVDAEFENIIYNITYAPAEHGSIEGSATGTYQAGISVIDHPENGYELVSLKANDVDVDLQYKAFSMPAEDVEVTAEFDGVYKDITVAETENGTLTATPSDKQRYTHEVTVAYTPNNGYVIDKILVTNTDAPTTPAIDITSSLKFNMPLYNVTITATFKEGFWTDDDIRDLTWYTENPNATAYHFTDARQLGGLSYLVNGLPKGSTNDPVGPIDFEGVTFYIDNAIDMHIYKWRPIGGQLNVNYSFEGTFEGNGHAITDMTIDDPKGSYQAFFGVVGKNAVVNNLYISGTSYGKYWVAGVAGKNSGTIMNCVSSVRVTSVFEAAGIAANNIGTVKNCYNRGDIENTSANFGKAYLNVGGIVATNAKGATINNVYNVGTLKGTGTSPVSYFGGIVGKNTAGGTVTNAYWLNTITKGVGTGTINSSCHIFTPEEGQAENGIVAALEAQVGTSEVLLHWALVTGEYLYPVFVQPEAKGGEIADIDENVIDFNLNLYPNPADRFVNIESEGIQRITVVNTLGQIVIDQNYDTDRVELDIHTLSAGLYTVNVVTVNGTTAKNLVITR